MNDFTKEDLQIIYLDMTIYAEKTKLLKESPSHKALRDKIQSLIDNYCEHDDTGISQQDFNDLAWMATRYTLGRKTYAVSVVTNILRRHASKLYNGNRYQIGEEIASAINSGQAGMDMAIKEWNELLEVFAKVKDV